MLDPFTNIPQNNLNLDHHSLSKHGLEFVYEDIMKVKKKKITTYISTCVSDDFLCVCVCNNSLKPRYIFPSARLQPRHKPWKDVGHNFITLLYIVTYLGSVPFGVGVGVLPAATSTATSERRPTASMRTSSA